MSIPRNLSKFAANTSATGEPDVTDVTGTLPVANGGTGLTSPGTSGNILVSNGTGFVSQAPAGGGFSQAQIFTSSGTFTVPASGKFKVTIIGGGGSGRSVTSGTSGSSSGAGGGTVIKWFTGATPGATATVVIGAGGAGSTTPDADGNAGGTSTFTLSGFTTLTANGGAGGASNTPAIGGTASGGDLNLPGQNSTGIIDGSSDNVTGSAGSSFLAFGIRDNQNFNNSGPPGIYGAGSVARFNSNPTGNGGDGVCIVEY